MNERCQAKFKEKNTNKNYFYYIGVGVVLLAVLCCYRFLFGVISLTYGLGCAACYFALDANILQRFLNKISHEDETDTQETQAEAAPKKGCTTCGLKDCQRHDETVSAEPWVGLRIHKQLDQAIEDFYNAILEEFVSSWYSKLTLQPFFLDELRHRMRYASACLLKRALKINYTTLITDKLVPCALHHFTQYAIGPNLQRETAPRILANRASELNYLRSVTEAIAPALLPAKDLKNEVFFILLREIFAGWVLLSLTDVLADPYILNTLIVLATGDETMAQLPSTPDYTVEFLETFARQSESVYTQRCKLLKLDLEQVLEDQEMFYAFMQFLKTTSHIHLLQFYKDIKSFQTKLLNPVLCDKEKQSILNEAQDIFTTYFEATSASNINLDQSLVDEMKSLLTCNNGEDSIRKLQTSKALYQAARQSHAALEKIMLPRFLHSEEFYNLTLGSRIPTGYHKQMTKKPDKLAQTAQRLNNKLLSQQLDNMSSEESDLNILQYLDCLLADESLEHDLTGCRAALQDVQIVQQAPPRRGPVRVFTLAVNLAPSGRPPTFLAPRRTEHDFHLLNSKLQEFHGHVAPRQLPSRRDNSPLETLRYKYEDYLQQLLQKPILQTSELLHLFLTVEGDFSQAVQASSLGGNGTDLANIYQTVAHRLKKEKGQHLEGFLKNFLVSSDMDRYQALKQNSATVEEAMEVNDDTSVVKFTQAQKTRGTRDITNGVFGDNFGVEPVVNSRKESQGTVRGFVQCLVFFLQKVINARPIITAVVGTVLSISRDTVDRTFNMILDRELRSLLREQRLAHLIRLGHSLLFGKKANEPRTDPDVQRELARKQLMLTVPPAVAMVTGPGLGNAISRAFELVQSPQLNKLLVYELLDLCLAELFPELLQTDEENKNAR